MEVVWQTLTNDLHGEVGWSILLLEETFNFGLNIVKIVTCREKNSKWLDGIKSDMILHHKIVV